MEKLDVIANFDWMDKEEKVGTLGHEYLRGSDVFSFEFDKNWLKTFPKIDFGRRSCPKSILGQVLSQFLSNSKENTSEPLRYSCPRVPTFSSLSIQSKLAITSNFSMCYLFEARFLFLIPKSCTMCPSLSSLAK